MAAKCARRSTRNRTARGPRTTVASTGNCGCLRSWWTLRALQFHSAAQVSSDQSAAEIPVDPCVEFIEAPAVRERRHASDQIPPSRVRDNLRELLAFALLRVRNRLQRLLEPTAVARICGALHALNERFARRRATSSAHS